jgi:hypothetical protein
VPVAGLSPAEIAGRLVQHAEEVAGTLLKYS